MRVFIVTALFAVVVMASAQRSYYTELADRFKTDDATTACLANCIGEDRQGITTTTARLPVDAGGEQELVNIISKWPVYKQPFWYLNWKHVQQHRAQRPTLAPENAQNAGFGDRSQPQPQSRSSFTRNQNLNK